MISRNGYILNNLKSMNVELCDLNIFITDDFITIYDSPRHFNEIIFDVINFNDLRLIKITKSMLDFAKCLIEKI